MGPEMRAATRSIQGVSSTGQAWAFQVATGRPLWSVALPRRASGAINQSRPLLAARHVFLTNRADELVALSLDDGSVVATLNQPCRLDGPCPRRVAR